MHTRLVKARHSIREAEGQYCGNSVKVLSRVWILTQLCTIALVIAGFALGTDRSNVGYAFIGVWVALLAIFLGVMGTLILRKYRTVATHGALTGMSFMMAQIMLISACVAGTRRKCGDGSTASQATVGAFSVLLFFLYLLFTWLLVKFKADIIAVDDDDDVLTSIEMNGGVEEEEEEEEEADIGGTSEAASGNGNVRKLHGENSDLKMV